MFYQWYNFFSLSTEFQLINFISQIFSEPVFDNMLQLLVQIYVYGQCYSTDVHVFGFWLATTIIVIFSKGVLFGEVFWESWIVFHIILCHV